MLNSLDFNRLKVFYYIYLNKSIIGAAKELNVTPSAVSQHLKKLEDEIRVRLFTRMHKKLVPTIEAETLFHILNPFFNELEAGLTLFKHGKNKAAGLLRIGAPVEFGKAYFPGIITAFRKNYPEVTFSLTLGNSETLLGLVKKGELDFAVTDLFLSQKQYVSDLGIYYIESIIDEEIILACSKSYFNIHIKKDVSLKNILSKDFISYDKTDLALKGWFKHHFGKQSVKINTVLTVDSVQAVLSAIENNLGLGVIASHTIHDQIQKGAIIPVPTTKKEIINKISLVQLQDKVPGFTEKTFQSFLKKRLQAI